MTTRSKREANGCEESAAASPFLVGDARQPRDETADASGRCPSLFAAVDGEFGTICFGEPGFVLQARWNRSIANHAGIAQLVEREQFRSQRMTPSMSLAALLIDAHL